MSQNALTVGDGTKSGSSIFALFRRRVSIITLPTTNTFSGATPSARRFRTPDSSVTKNRSLMASVSFRLISSGIDMSKDRRPASTWATFVPSFFAGSAHPMVEFTSPTTTTQSGFSWRRYFSKATMILAVCSAWDPEPTSRCRSGSGISSSRKKTSDMFSS